MIVSNLFRPKILMKEESFSIPMMGIHGEKIQQLMIPS